MGKESNVGSMLLVLVLFPKRYGKFGFVVPFFNIVGTTIRFGTPKQQTIGEQKMFLSRIVSQLSRSFHSLVPAAAVAFPCSVTEQPLP